MTLEKLLERLSRRANRYRVGKVTKAVFYDWLEADLAAAPRKRGRLRGWSSREYRRALEVVRIKSQGVRSHAIVRILLFLKGYDVPVSDFETRKALGVEFRKFRNSLIGKIHSTYPVDRSGKDPEWRKARIIEKTGPLDASLKSFVQYERDELVDAYTLLKFGESNGKLNDAAARIFSQMAPRIFQKLAPNVGPPTLNKIHDISGLISGFWRRPEDGDAPEGTITAATEADFMAARSAMPQAISSFQILGLGKIERSLIHSWQWRISIFVWLLDPNHRNRLKAVEQALEIK